MAAAGLQGVQATAFEDSQGLLRFGRSGLLLAFEPFLVRLELAGKEGVIDGLEAIPYAALCVKCASRQEERRG